jgi:hypothetical protein
MNGVILQAFIKLNAFFKTQPSYVLTEFTRKGVSVEDIARDLFLPHPKKITPNGVNYFRKILGLNERKS